MGVVGRLDQYASMLAWEFDDYSMSENFVSYSTYNASFWSNIYPAGASLTTGITAPDGTNTAVRFTCNNTTNALLRVTIPSLTPNGTDTYTSSFYVRKISGTGSALTDLADGNPFADYSSQLVTNQWVRVTASGVPTATAKTWLDLFSDNNTNYVLDFWGVQLERGSVATDYTPTTGTAITRVLSSTTNTSITGLGTYYSSGFDENVGFATFLSANVFAPYDPVYDEFSGTSFGAGQGRYMRQNADKSVIVYNEIDEVTDFRDIVRTGLVLDLDAGMNASFNNTGTTWNDLSGLSNNATMFGSVPFSTDVAPCFDFATATGANAASSSLGFTFGSNMIPTTGDFTFSCWIKNPNASTAQVGLFSNAGSTDGYRFGLNLSSVYFLIGPTYTEGNISFSSTLSSSLWYNVVAVFSRTTAQVLVYLNGVYQSAASIPVSQTAFNGAAVPGLVKSACCTIYTGKLAGFSAYSKALTASEITQNYNALRHRFGL